MYVLHPPTHTHVVAPFLCLTLTLYILSLSRYSHSLQVFGIAPLFTWFLPVDPIFEDYDRVMGYTMPQRLDRERQFCDAKRPVPQISANQSLELPKCVNDLLPV
jgi:hypothetical protein